MTKFVLLLLVLPFGAVAAQRGYARGPADTTRLRERTHATSSFTTRNGTEVITADIDAVIALTNVKGDSARAWFDFLDLKSLYRANTQHPDAKVALRKPFKLLFDSRGRVTMIETPRFTAPIDSVTDLRHEFDDFFLPLPPQPLAKGLVWTDSSGRDDQDDVNGRFFRIRRYGTYTVQRDTVVNGRHAFVISSVADTHLTANAPLTGGYQNGVSQSVLNGGDTSVYVFDAAAGRMLGRKRQGFMGGTLILRPVEGAPVLIGQEVRYSGTISAVGKP